VLNRTDGPPGVRPSAVKPCPATRSGSTTTG